VINITFTQKDLNLIINDIIINVVDNVSDITDANVGSILRQLIESISIELDELYTQLNNVYEGTRVDTATGEDLEQIGKIVGINRKTGTQALSNVSFIRNSPATSDFTISSGLIISTQPNTGDTQYRFLTSSNTTFYSSITDEEVEFKEGIYDYRLSERFIGETSSVNITGLTSSSTTTYIINTDFGIVEDYNNFLVNVSTIVEIDDCDATTDWNESDDAQATTTSTDKKEGTNSLNLGKNGTSTVNATYSKTLGSVVNGSNKDLVLWLYITDTTTLNKIKNVKLWIGSGGSITNSYEFVIQNSTLATGWNMYRLQTSTASTIKNSNPNASSYNYLRIKLITNNTTDTITLGNVKMDYWHFATTESYEGDIIRWTDDGTKPDDGSDVEVDYTPLSREVECVAEFVGSDYNVGRKKIVYQVSNIANINNVSNYTVMSGGTDEEVDVDLKQRILYATELKGKATSESIRQAILGVNGVASCTVDDLPLRSATSENHLFSSATTTYQLDREVLYLNSATSPTNITIAGTASSTSTLFTYGTDYSAVYDSNGVITSEIEWQSGGTSPDDTTVFFVDYEYNWLGHAIAFVSGTENPIPSSVETNVLSAIEESRSAGITVSLTTPSIVTIDVTCSISADSGSGYTYNDLYENVGLAIEEYIDNLEVGEDVYLAQLYRVITGVVGVENVTITTPASDTVISSSEIARSGTITVNEI
jgi:uncharacterized phage protein gp47/JayE